MVERPNTIGDEFWQHRIEYPNSRLKVVSIVEPITKQKLTSEYVIPFELGEITTEHWLEILKRVKGKDESTQKVRRVISSLLAGTIQDTAPYFGKRHWRKIQLMGFKDKVKTPRRFPLPSKISKTINPVALEIVSHASFINPHVNLTLNDKLEVMNSFKNWDNVGGSGRGSKSLRWDGRCWEGNETEIIVEKESGHYFEIPTAGPSLERDELERWVRRLWPLREEDCTDTLRYSPKELTRMYKDIAIANPEHYPRLELEFPQSV